MQIRLSRRAEEDIDGIKKYTLSNFGDVQMERYLSLLETALLDLKTHPNLGKPADHVKAGCRMLSVGSHMIFYTVSQSHIVVFRVLHQRMNPLLHLEL